MTCDFSLTWEASHKRLALSGAGPSAGASGSAPPSPAATLVANSWTTPFSTANTRPSGQGSPRCRPGPSTATGLPKRS